MTEASRSLPTRKFTTWTIIVVVSSLVAVILSQYMPFVRTLENWLSDFRTATVSPWTDVPKSIVIVTITEDTLAELRYRSPVDREFLARTLSHIVKGAPRAVAIDLLFDQATEPEKDGFLEDVLRKAQETAPVYSVYAGAEEGLTARQEEHLNAFLDGLPRGFANLLADDEDGTVRMLFDGRDGQEGWLPGIATALASLGGVQVRKGTVPLTYLRDDEGRPASFPVFKAHQVTKLPPAWFKDKFVLIGADLPTFDRHRTPFATLVGTEMGTIPGIFIHAHALAQLLQGYAMVVPGLSVTVLIVVVVSALSLGVAAVNLPISARGALIVILLMGLWGAGFWLLWEAEYMVPLVAPTIAVVLSAGAAFAAQWQADRKERAYIKGAFSRYLSPSLVDMVAAEPDKLRLGGERREVTYLFTDLAGFTTFVEKNPPEEAAAILNAYLDRVCAAVLDAGATIDKIVGGAVVVFFNAPVNQPDPAESGVRLALEIDAICEAFREECRANGVNLGVTRVGVNTGKATIGNFGGSRFFDYTGHGDPVNTAARLESVNKHLGTRICISETSMQKCSDIRFRPVGTLILKGKTQGIGTFQPFPVGQTDDELYESYSEAFRLMAEKKTGAIEAFEDLVRQYPDDPLSRFHLARMQKGDTGADVTFTEK